MSAQSIELIHSALGEAAAALDHVRRDSSVIGSIEAAGALLAQAFAAGQRAYSCGNGGSMCDAMHFAEELTGRFRRDRRPLAALAISDPGHLSCVANDFGYPQIFARFVQAHGRAGDVLLGVVPGYVDDRLCAPSGPIVGCLWAPTNRDAGVPVGKGHGEPGHGEGPGDRDLALWAFTAIATLFSRGRSHHEFALGHDNHLGASVAFSKADGLPGLQDHLR